MSRQLPLRRILLLVMAAGLTGCLAFGAAYCAFPGTAWYFTAAVTSGMFAYHMFIRFLSPAALWLFFRKRYDYRRRWFQQKPWEPELYRFLRVKRWKTDAITYDPREFSLRLHSLEEVINNMCHAEAVHELTAVFSLASVLFAIPFGAVPVFWLTALAAAAADLSCVAIQRYNRPRLVKISERKRAADP